LRGFEDGFGAGRVRVGAAAGALLARRRGMACDEAAGAPGDVVRAGVDELAGPRLRDGEVLDWDGRAVTLPSGPLGAAAH
jgi:hypothetical protein